ncbi:MAG: trigger factor [Campylobacteraceae bacterium]|nr:trigger factor [Campylobacteraceae bacterium]
MKVSSKLINQANASIDAQIDAKSIEAKVDEIAKKTAKQVRIDGFRPGKVPVAVVKQRYAKELLDDAKQDALRAVLDKAMDELKKDKESILGEPVFTKFEEKDGSIDATIEVSFRPEVDVAGYEEAIAEYATPRVMKKDIEAKIEELLLMIAPIEKVEKEALENGDFAKFDFEGFKDGEAFEGGSAKDYMLEIGSNRFIPGFEEGMVGMKVGEEKDINLKFPEEYGAEHLAGQEVVFKVKLNEIHAKTPTKELDEEALKRLLPGEEEATQAKLEERIKEQLREDKFQVLLNEELKPKFVENILEKINFDLPKSIVEQEMDLQFRNSWATFTPEDMEKFRTDKDALTNKREEYRAEAEKSVKLTFIIDELAKVRNVEVSDQELVQAIYFEAYQYGIDPKKHLEDYKNQGILPAVKMALIEDKLFNDLYRKKDKKEDEKGE